MECAEFDLYGRIASIYGMERREAEIELHRILTEVWETATEDVKTLLRFCGMPDAAACDVILMLAGHAVSMLL